MATFKVKKRTRNFTIVSNTCPQDPRLSFKARGILLYLLSLPEDWVISIKNIIEKTPDGRDAVYSGISELKKHGYIVESKLRDEKGRITKTTYDVYEIPKTDFPDHGEQDPDFPDQDNPQLQNNNIYKEKKNKEITATKQCNAAVALDVCNSAIDFKGGVLTDSQKSLIKRKISGYVSDDEIIERLYEEIVYVILDKNAFTLIGNDFKRKLNAILKQIKDGVWSTPVQILNIAESKLEIENKKMCEIIRKKSSDINSLKIHKSFAEKSGRLDDAKYFSNEIIKIKDAISKILSEKA